MSKMLHYEIREKAENATEWVVFIHGIGGSTRTWIKQIREFSKEYKVLLLDLPGHGGSQEDEDITTNGVNNSIKEVLDFVGIEKANFVGLSLGTLVIANFAVQYPEYVNAIVLGGATIQLKGFGKFVLSFVNRIKAAFPNDSLYRIFSHILLPGKKQERARMCFLKEALKLERDNLFAWVDYACEMTHPQVLIQKLRDAKLNILFISGKNDTFFIKTAQAISEVISASLIILNDCGHACTLEKYQEFNQKALEYLKSKTSVATAALTA